VAEELVVSRLGAWLLGTVAVLLAPVGVALAVVGERHGLDLPDDRGSEVYLKLAAASAAVLFAVVGLLIARRVRGNAIGWLFLGIGLSFALLSVSYGYADLALYGGREWNGGVWAAWLASWLVIVPAFEAPCIVAQLFPDGRTLPGRWRLLLWLSVAAAVYLVLPASVGPGPLSSYSTVDNPTSLPGWVGTAMVDPVWGLLIFGLFGVSLASVVVRFRRSQGVERQQLRWLAAVAGITIASLVLAMFLNGLAPEASAAFFVVVVAGIVATPVAVGIAILRYRLYEIDRIVSRTLTYGALSVVLVGAYAGLVLAGQALFSSFAGGSNLAIAVSTLVVAALFLPLRTRFQRAVDRRFNRRQYDAQRTVEAFAARLRDEVELDTLRDDLMRVVAETVQPTSVSAWLRGAEGE